MRVKAHQQKFWAAGRDHIDGWIPTKDRLPKEYEQVFLLTDAYASAGYVNDEGQWRSLRGQPEVKAVRFWQPFDAGTGEA